MSIESNPMLNAYPRTDEQFFNELQEKIASTNGPEDRISIHTLSLEPAEPRAQAILNELASAALRGVDTTFITDAYTLLFPHRIGALVAYRPKPVDKPGLDRREMALDDLRLSNVNVGIVNIPDKGLFANTARGRSHMKIGVVNDQVLLGGPNLHDTERTDMSVGFTHRETAEWLHHMISDLAQSSATKDTLGSKDIEYVTDMNTRILIDVGKPKQSIIMDETLDIIDRAEECLTIGSPFFPSGIVAQHLLASGRKGIDIRIVYDHPRNQGALALAHYCARALYQVTPRKNISLHPSQQKSPPLHTKAIASEKTGMITSHNFTPATVRMGMTEIGFVRHDRTFARSVSNLLLQSTNGKNRT